MSKAKIYKSLQDLAPMATKDPLVTYQTAEQHNKKIDELYFNNTHGKDKNGNELMYKNRDRWIETATDKQTREQRAQEKRAQIQANLKLLQDLSQEPNYKRPPIHNPMTIP